jgi:hypothetical protein
MMAILLSEKGTSPNNNVNKRIPKDQISAGSARYGFDKRISGDANETVP